MVERVVDVLIGESTPLDDLGDVVAECDPNLVGATVEHEVHTDRYFDTADLRLARWGCALRHRRGAGWIATIPRPGKQATRERIDVPVRGRGTVAPPTGARQLVASLTRGAAVAEVATVTERSATHRWTDEPRGDHVRVTVAEQEWAVASDTVAHRHVRLETTGPPEPAEPDAGQSASPVDCILERLVALGGEPDVSPIARGLGVLGLAPDVAVAEPESRPSARAVIHRAISTSVRQLLLQVPGARIGDDPEGVHQARVATRRLRSDLRTFAPLLDEAWVTSLRAELKWLADALGAVRDDDVLLDRLRAAIASATDLDPVAAHRVVSRLEDQRDEHRDELLTALDARRTQDLLDRLVEATVDPPTVGRAIGRADRRLAPLARRPWGRLHELVDSLDDEPPVEQLHRVRLLAKRSRYAAEAVAPAVGEPARSFALAVAEIQDVLGELNDAEVAAAWLASVAPDLDGAAGFVAGRLAERFDAEGITHRHGWERAYRKATRPKRQAWLG